MVFCAKHALEHFPNNEQPPVLFCHFANAIAEANKAKDKRKKKKEKEKEKKKSKVMGQPPSLQACLREKKKKRKE